MAVIIGLIIGREIWRTPVIPAAGEIKIGTPIVNVTIVDTTIQGRPYPVYVSAQPVVGISDSARVDDSIRVYQETYTDSLGSSVIVTDTVRGLLYRQSVDMRLKSIMSTRVDTITIGDPTYDRWKLFLATGTNVTPDGVTVSLGADVIHKNSMYYYKYDPFLKMHSVGAGFKLGLRP